MIDPGSVWARAQAALQARRPQDALPHLRQLLSLVDRIEFEYETWLRAAAAALDNSGRHAQARAADAYLAQLEAPSPQRWAGLEAKLEQDPSAGRRELGQLGVFLEHAGQHAAAARAFEASQLPVHQAIALERAGQDAAAAELWRALISREQLQDHPYELALAKINYALCLHRLGDEGARAAIGEGTRAVEEVADSFESDGRRERAFDCYQLLARVGMETKAFENVAEGFLNSVRILRSDSLKRDALGFYEAFAALAEAAGEHHAVATVLREAAEFCERSRLPYAADLRLRAGEAWIQSAKAATHAGHPSQIVENAYLAAADAFVAVRAFRRAALVYRALAELDVRGGERYRRLLQRLGKSPTDGPEPTPVPKFMKRLPSYVEVWYVDIAEWELRGDPAMITAGVLADRRLAAHLRRHALLLLLDLAEAKREGTEIAPLVLAKRLKDTRTYPVIAILESLYASGTHEVQAGVVKALSAVRFKRSFGLVGQALRSKDPGVRAAARAAVADMYFPHAFDRLRALFEARDIPEREQLRQKVIAAIGNIRSPDAVEFLCDRLREDDPQTVEQVKNALSALRETELLPYLREEADMVPAKHRSLLHDVAQRLEDHAR